MYVLAYVGIMANNMAIPAMGCLGYPCNGFPRSIPVMGCRGCPCNGLPFFVWRIIGSLPLKGIPKEVSYAHLDTTKEASYSTKNAVALVPNQGGRRFSSRRTRQQHQPKHHQHRQPTSTRSSASCASPCASAARLTSDCGGQAGKDA